MRISDWSSDVCSSDLPFRYAVDLSAKDASFGQLRICSDAIKVAGGPAFLLPAWIEFTDTFPKSAKPRLKCFVLNQRRASSEAPPLIASAGHHGADEGCNPHGFDNPCQRPLVTADERRVGAESVSQGGSRGR